MLVGIFKANASIKIIYDKKKVQLDPASSRRYFNGTALGLYLTKVIKLAETHKQKLGVENSVLEKLKNQSNPQSKLFNWNYLCTQLEVSCESQIDILCSENREKGGQRREELVGGRRH